MSNTTFLVNSPNVVYDETTISAKYSYQSSRVTSTNTTTDDGCQAISMTVTPITENLLFKTDRKVPKLGLMLVGWGGNNGTTVTAGILANKLGLTWHTKEGLQRPNYFGSITQSSVISLGQDALTGQPVHLPMNQILPMVHPNDIILGGWDISSMNLGDAMYRAKVLDYDLMQQLYPYMKDMKPLPSIYNESFIALNQKDRADNLVLPVASDSAEAVSSLKWTQVERIREDIRHFKQINDCDKVIVLWTATTERFSEILPGINDTAENVLNAVKADHPEISPSSLFAIASILEHCAYINGSPQNTFVPGIQALAEQEKIFLVGDDFKSGQTKLKSILVDFLVSAGLKPASIVSYNHLGNNDGKNLSAPEQFQSKEMTKKNVVDDMVQSNSLLYPTKESHPDHVVVIKYVPYVGDSKRAMDEYTSEIFLNGKNTIVIHNTCEDSLLASPLIYDLAILTELCQRIQVKSLSNNGPAAENAENEREFEHFHPILSLLSYLMKAPMVPSGTPVVNALAAQRQCLVNVMKACVGLPPDNFMTLEHKIPSMMWTNTNGRKRKVEESDDA